MLFFSPFKLKDGVLLACSSAEEHILTNDTLLMLSDNNSASCQFLLPIIMTVCYSKQLMNDLLATTVNINYSAAFSPSLEIADVGVGVCKGG